MNERAYRVTAFENFSYELADWPNALITSMPPTYSTDAALISSPAWTVFSYHDA